MEQWFFENSFAICKQIFSVLSERPRKFPYHLLNFSSFSHQPKISSGNRIANGKDHLVRLEWWFRERKPSRKVIHHNKQFDKCKHPWIHYTVPSPWTRKSNTKSYAVPSALVEIFYSRCSYFMLLNPTRRSTLCEVISKIASSSKKIRSHLTSMPTRWNSKSDRKIALRLRHIFSAKLKGWINRE